MTETIFTQHSHGGHGDGDREITVEVSTRRTPQPASSPMPRWGLPVLSCSR